MPSTVLLRLCIGLCMAAFCTSLGACAGVKPAGGPAGTGGNDASVEPPHQDGSPLDFVASADLVIVPPHSECGDGTRTRRGLRRRQHRGGDGCSARLPRGRAGLLVPAAREPCHAHRALRRRRGRLPGAVRRRQPTPATAARRAARSSSASTCSGEPSACAATTCGDKKLEGAEGVRRRQHGAVRRLLARLSDRARVSRRALLVQLRRRPRAQRRRATTATPTTATAARPACKIEAGFTCTHRTSCASKTACSRAVYRDFSADDAAPTSSIGCGQRRRSRASSSGARRARQARARERQRAAASSPPRPSPSGTGHAERQRRDRGRADAVRATARAAS